MAKREYVVDVSSFQGISLSGYHRAGAKQVIVKLTEGSGYFNPKARGQIKSAHAHHMYVHAYHFANFSNSVGRAKQEAKTFIARAKALNVSKKRYLALDWEAGTYNSVVGSKYSNTRAIIAFMSVVKRAGYKVMLYSGASLLRNNIDTSKVVKKFGTCLWVASYTTMGRIDAPNFGYFPSMNGVALWQFTDDWKGMSVDASISLIELHNDAKAKKSAKKKASKPKSKAKSKPKTVTEVYAPIINHNPNWKIALCTDKGHITGKYIPTNSRWKVFGERKIGGIKYYKLGSNVQWVPAKYLKVTKTK